MIIQAVQHAWLFRYKKIRRQYLSSDYYYSGFLGSLSDSDKVVSVPANPAKSLGTIIFVACPSAKFFNAFNPSNWI